jgi:protein TonB
MPPRFGPWARPWQPLSRRRFPLAAIGVSVLGHALFAAALVAVIVWTGWHTSKVHVVNLVPAVAAVGHPRAPAAPTLPSRPTTPVPRAVLPAPREPLPREPAPREEPSREPARLPEPPRAAPRLPSRPALVRPGERELPPLAAPAPRPLLAQRAERATERPVESRPAPAASLGQVAGSPAGVGALSLDVSDFPHAWYLRQILQKIAAQWERQGQARQPDQVPQIFVEIQRDGSIRTPRIEKSSGNSLYDHAAVRAVLEASPFPPLPQDWSRPSLRILFTFELEARRG